MALSPGSLATSAAPALQASYPARSPAISRYCAQGQAGARGQQIADHAWLNARAFLRDGLRSRIDDGVDIGTDLPDAILKRWRGHGFDIFQDHVASIPLGCLGLQFLRLRLLTSRQFLPRGRGLVLGAPHRLLTLRLVGRDIDLQIVWQRSEALLAVVRP